LASRPVLLEPIVTLEVTVPSKYTGAILGDLNTKRARIENQDSLPGDLAVIQAKVPLAEVTRYAAQLGSITQGQGSYAMEFSHYDVVPGNVQQQIVSKAKVAAEEWDWPPLCLFPCSITPQHLVMTALLLLCGVLAGATFGVDDDRPTEMLKI